MKTKMMRVSFTKVEHFRLLLIWMAFLLTTAASRDMCWMQDFTAIESRTYPGEVILQTGPDSWLDCRRICRLYSDCFAFSVRWNEGSDQTGLCRVFSGMVKYSNLIWDNETTTYLSCPPTMRYNITSQTCRTVDVLPETTWYEASKRCAQIHPDAHLLEIRTAADQAFIEDVANGLNLWLGMYRPEGGDQNDFVYCSDQQPLTYTHFYSTQPDNSPTNLGSPPDCVASYDKRDTNHYWYDAPCGYSTYNYFCEL